MKIWNIGQDQAIDEIFREAGLLIKEGNLVAFPTETVYGLGGDGLNPEACKKIFAAKGRPADNPLILHIYQTKQLDELTLDVPETAKALIKAFWPGPLTLVLPKSVRVPYEATGGLESVAVRMPDHPIALGLIEAAGTPIAAPSANLSGKPSPTRAQDVLEDLADRIDGLIDGGDTQIGLESTVVDCTGSLPVILRPGQVTQEMLEKIAGIVELDPHLMSEEQAPKAPGMKYNHYAPKALMKLAKTNEGLAQEAYEATKTGKKVAVLVDEEFNEALPEGVIVQRWGSLDDRSPLARYFYSSLRQFDRDEIELILALAVPEEGLGVAIMNRMRKAAGNQFVEEESE